MPTIFFYGPDLDYTKKKELISHFTDTASRLTGMDKATVTIYLRSSPPNSVGVGGKLLSEILEKHNK